MDNVERKSSESGIDLPEVLRSRRLLGDTEVLVRQATDLYQSELASIVHDLRLAERCTQKALRRLYAGDVLSARRWIDRACDAEYRALGECEGAGWIGDALGSECPWRVVSESRVDGERRLVVVSTCTRHRCMLATGDTVRAIAGFGAVVELTTMPRKRASRCRTGTRHLATVRWPEDAIRPPCVWKVDPDTIRCGEG